MTIQQRLLVFFLIVVLIPMVDTALLTTRVLTTALERKAEKDLEVDLKWAWSVVRQRMERLKRAAQQAAAAGLNEALGTDPSTLKRVQERLLQLKQTQRLSFAALLGAENVVLSRANGREVGFSYPPLTVLEGAWAGEVTTGLEFIPASLVEREGLRREAEVALLVPSEVLRDGLALVAAVPVQDERGQARAVLVVGELLNNQTVLPDLVGEPTGHVLSVWLGDICVATNARRADGSRAVGEKLRQALFAPGAPEGYQEVILAGQPQKAIRSNIRNSANQIIGALQVGIPVSQIEEPRRRALAIILLASAGGSAIAVIVAFYLARRISRPLADMVAVTRQVARGDLSAEVPVSGRDEIGQLASSFNQMIRDLARAQEQLVRSQRLAAIGQLASSMSHELRNPLSVLRSSAYYLRSRLADADEKVRKHLDIIEQEISNSDKIITDLLDFSRIKPPTLQRTYLNYIVEEALERVEIPPSVKLVRDLAEGLPPIQADAFQLEQVVVNLLTNAVQAMPQGGVLTVRTALREDSLVLEVSDTGCGIDPEHLERIFEPLFTTKSRGIGLGLTICKTLVENHGGTITVESTPGRGTTFTITLPREPAVKFAEREPEADRKDD